MLNVNNFKFGLGDVVTSFYSNKIGKIIGCFCLSAINDDKKYIYYHVKYEEDCWNDDPHFSVSEYLGKKPAFYRIKEEDILLVESSQIVKMEEPVVRNSSIENDSLDALRYLSANVFIDMNGLDKAPDPQHTPKCDCGAKAVGSSMHSHWCSVADKL